MKKVLLVALVLVPLAGCAHQQGGYAGGPSGFFYDDCLDGHGYGYGYGYGYGCEYGLNHRYYSTYDFLASGGSALTQRALITRVDRRTSTRVVKRSQSSPPSPSLGPSASRAVPARSAPTAAISRSAPAAAMSHSAPATHSSQTVSRR